MGPVESLHAPRSISISVWKALDAYFQDMNLLMQNFTFFMPFCNQNGIIGFKVGNGQQGLRIPFWLQKGMKM